jgi:hypothetical protein
MTSYFNPLKRVQHQYRLALRIEFLLDNCPLQTVYTREFGLGCVLWHIQREAHKILYFQLSIVILVKDLNKVN